MPNSYKDVTFGCAGLAYDGRVTDSLARELEAERALGRKLGTYVGEWVAVVNHDVVAHAHSFDDLMRRVDEIQRDDPDAVDTVFKVLDSDGPWFF